MKNTSKIIPCYAADTSGVCSALYELGGMTVVHDASGCNSTYSTHDEPRWYDKKSRIFISALTEMDAIMGDDEKLIRDTVSAAKDLAPNFIALCGSPMPMMTGVDFEAIAEEVQRRSGVRTFGLRTNGTHSYLKGASQAFLEIVKEFVKEPTERTKMGVNILGAMPLDFSAEGTINSIKEWLAEYGFELVSCLAMGSELSDISKAAAARVNLVISYSGLAAAQYMNRKFGIPYVCGVPVGRRFSKKLAENLWLAVQEQQSLYTCADRRTDEEGVQVIGESIFAGSLAAAFTMDMGRYARVICPLDTDISLLAKGDLDISAEEDIEKALNGGGTDGVAADPMYRYISPENAEFFETPHFAFSGRCYQKKALDLINKPIGEIFE